MNASEYRKQRDQALAHIEQLERQLKGYMKSREMWRQAYHTELHRKTELLRDVDMLNKDNENLTNQVESLQTQLEGTNDAVAMLRGEVKDWQERYQGLSDYNDRVCRECDELRNNEPGIWTKDKSALVQEVNGLKDQLHSTELWRDQHFRDKVAAENKLSAVTNMLHQQETYIIGLKAEVFKLDEANGALEIRLERANNWLAYYKGRELKLQAKLGRAQNECNTLRIELDKVNGRDWEWGEVTP